MDKAVRALHFLWDISLAKDPWALRYSQSTKGLQIQRLSISKYVSLMASSACQQSSFLLFQYSAAMFSVLSLDSIFIMIIPSLHLLVTHTAYFVLTFYCNLFYTINKMRRHPLQLAILLLSIATIHSQFSKCPAANPLQIASGSITVSKQGQVGIVNGVDIQCYNYTLATPFTCTPGVAIAVNGMESQYSPNIFFSIKAVNSDSNGVIPFVVRTHWAYTRWTRLVFSFIAEASSQIEAGYYQIDTASLSSCCSGKQISAFIPFASQSGSFSSALTFLNGFEVSSITVNSSYLTPFEVQIVMNSVSRQGISVLLTSTSATQVHSIFVSYVAFDPNIQNLVAGSYVYNKYLPRSSLSFTPPIGVSNNNLAFHGFNGFIANNNQANFLLSGALVNGNLSFASSSNFYYLSYSYFFLIGGPCGQCVGYSINYNGNCVASCPPNSYYNGFTCVTCLSGQVWNGSACVAIIVQPPVINNTTPAVPFCPVGTYWDQQQLKCLPCPSGCLSCTTCDSCNACASGFVYNSATSLCSQICGDGKRFVLPCDDGNTISGDGCSSTCQIQAGYFCVGGSPNSRDNCSRSTPRTLVFNSSGQSHQWGKIILNVRVNYLPIALIQSSSDCRSNCRDVLSVKIISGDSSAVSIIASYIPTTSYSFSVLIDFQKQPIGLFAVQIGINPTLIPKYFSGIDTSNTLTLSINPAAYSLDTTLDAINLTR